ncbi:MAG: proliferating cell nuclear antigen (pcna), partial [Candidatus Micrarchaeia archaeon]
EFENAREFKSAIEALSNLIDEGSFSIKKEGLGLHALDPSQIAMVVFTMPSSAFADYQIESSQNVGLNLENLNKILNRGSTEKLSIYDEDNRVVVQFSDGKSKKVFKVPVIDVSGGIEREPKVEHDAEVLINSGKFKDAIKDISLVSSHITFEARGKTLKISASGDNAEAMIEYTEGEDGAIKKMDVKSVAKVTFPVQYLDDMVKGADNSEDVELSLKTNAPLKLKYKLGNATFVYYLAPRIDLE